MNKPVTVINRDGTISRMVKLYDGTSVDVSKPVPPFNATAWAHGMILDFSSKRWGGKGWYRDENGNLTRQKDRAIRIGKPKVVKPKRSVKPAINVLVGPDDINGRSLKEHRAKVDAMAARYDKGIDMLSGEAITDPTEKAGIAKPRKDEPWRSTRHAAYTDNEGLALLAGAFKALHDANPDNDDDDDTPKFNRQRRGEVRSDFQN